MIFPEEKIRSHAKKLLSGSERGAHSFSHVERVYDIAKNLGERMGANMRILGAAALLHDIGRPKEEETGKSHAILSGEMSKEFLHNIGYDEEEIVSVVEAIRSHRFSENIEPTSLEGEILSDADKLDAMGAIGIFRAIARATLRNLGIPGFLKHAEEKLLKLVDCMYTEEGEKIAHERHELLQAFVEKLKAEVRNDLAH
ncbi:MAG: HD domain-containing protein [Candidatus Thorarchaeota archaeon]